MTVGAVVAAWAYFVTMPRVALPDHMHNHTVIFKENLLSEADRAVLRAYIDEIGSLHTNIAADIKNKAFVKSGVSGFEHIGEAEPVNEHGACSHPFMTPSVDGTQCVLPGRVDVGEYPSSLPTHSGYMISH